MFRLLWHNDILKEQEIKIPSRSILKYSLMHQMLTINVNFHFKRYNQITEITYALTVITLRNGTVSLFLCCRQALFWEQNHAFDTQVTNLVDRAPTTMIIRVR